MGQKWEYAMAHAFCMSDSSSKNTDEHSEYVIRIVFPQQQWLRERASVLRESALPALLCLG